MKKYFYIVLFLFSILILNAQSFSFVHQSNTRSYIVHLPSGYIASNQYPLVFNLHGVGQTASQAELYTKMDATADANNFIVVYPNGISNQWNCGFFGTYGTGTDDVDFISVLIDTLKSHYNINLDRVYACGLSNGGFQSYRMACELSDKIAAIASVAATMSDSTFYYCNPTRPVPTLQIHGTTDLIVNYNGSAGIKPVEDIIQFWKTKNICTAAIETTALTNSSITDGSTVEFIKIKGCSLGIENWFYKISNGGHTWPNGLIDVPTNGNTNRDFDASQRIWDFFNLYTINGLVGIQDVNELSSLQVYPTPSNNFVMIETGLDHQKINIEILDLLGSTKANFTIYNNIEKINLDNFDTGNYLLKITQLNGNEIVKKITIVK